MIGMSDLTNDVLVEKYMQFIFTLFKTNNIPVHVCIFCTKPFIYKNLMPI